MAPTLTLHQGDARAVYAEHPVEVARKALLAAGDLEIESEEWRLRFRRVAAALPNRDRSIKREEDN